MRVKIFWSTIYSIPWVQVFPVSWIALEWIKLFSYVCVSDTMSFTSSMLFLVLIFVILTLQATCYFSLLRYSRTWSNKLYFTSMAVLLAEVVKLFTMLMVIFFQRGNVKAFTSYLTANLFVGHKATFGLSVPFL